MIQIVKSDAEHYSIRIDPWETQSRLMLSHILPDLFHLSYMVSESEQDPESGLLVQDYAPPGADFTNFFHSTAMWMDALTSCLHLLIKVLHSATDLSCLISSTFPRGNERKACVSSLKN